MSGSPQVKLATDFRRLDHAERAPVRREDMHAARPAAIEVIVAVDLHAVRGAAALAGDRRKDAGVVEETVGARR